MINRVPELNLLPIGGSWELLGQGGKRKEGVVAILGLEGCGIEKSLTIETQREGSIAPQGGCGKPAVGGERATKH